MLTAQYWYRSFFATRFYRVDIISNITVAENDGMAQTICLLYRVRAAKSENDARIAWSVKDDSNEVNDTRGNEADSKDEAIQW